MPRKTFTTEDMGPAPRVGMVAGTKRLRAHLGIVSRLGALAGPVRWPGLRLVGRHPKGFVYDP